MAKEKTPEEKAAWAAKMKAAKEAKEKERQAAAKAEAEKKAEEEKAIVAETTAKMASDEKDDEIAELKKLITQLQQQIAQPQQTQVVQVMADVEKVTMLWQAEVADDNVAVFGVNGMYGQVTGKTGTVIVPKSEWSRFYTETNRWFIDHRWLIVVSGMTDDEKELYHCKYKDGEILDRGAFQKIVEMKDGILDIFPQLCTAHQRMVATRFNDEWNAGKLTASDRSLIVKLNEMTKSDEAGIPANDPRKKGMFWPIIEGMNARDAQ